MIRRAVLATAATVGGLGLLLALKPHETAPVAAAPPTTQAPGSGSSSGSGTGSGGKQQGGDGGASTVNGQSVQTQYGPVQLQVTMAGGKITGVKALQVPPTHADAVPQLTQKALAAQSAEIDGVSGATYTSEGYKKSLQSALDQAAANKGGGGGNATAGGDQTGGDQGNGSDGGY